MKLKPPPVEVQQPHKLPTTSPPPHLTLKPIATEFASELIVVSLEIVARLLTVTARFMATLKCPVLTRELSGVRSRAIVSLIVKQIVAVRWAQQSLAPLSQVATKTQQQPRDSKSIATKSVTGLRMVLTGTAVSSPTATVRATETSRWNVTTRELSGARSRRVVSLDVKQIVVVVVIIVSFNQDSLDDRKKQKETKIMVISIFLYAENGLIHPENFPLL